ncbi:DNA-directed DNA polymerase [Pleurocapsales cyanobacterium LEGE 10410]|nr:DNA-directed DNA polymerase [Pleurocapsales cyanobacterium LEGE 10410]
MNDKHQSIAAKKIILKYKKYNKRDRPDAFYTQQETETLIKHYRYQRPVRVKIIDTKYYLIEDANQLKKLLDPLVDTVEKIGIDTETTGLDPYTSKVRLIQIAIAKHPVFIIDLTAIKKSELTPLKHLLASNCLKIGHNLKFDLMMLATAGINLAPPYFDTYLGYKVLTAGLKKTSTLEMVARKLLRVKLDKSAQKSDFSQNITQEQLQYAANDAAVLLPLHRKLNHQLNIAKLTETAETEFDCLNAVAQMELNGVQLNLDKWQLLKQNLLQQQVELEKKLQAHLIISDRSDNTLLTKLGSKINLSSPKQVVTAFNQLGIDIRSTNVKELIPLAQDYPVIRWLLEYRSLTTRINTFSVGLPQFVHPVTNRIQGHWWQIGARSGRFSCREPNLTNIPHDPQTRKCFTAAPGNVIIKADYSQIELRLMAKASGDRRMIEAYRHGEDLHRLTASFLFDKPIENIADEERKLGKIVNFGLIYGMGVAKFCLTTAKKHNIYLSKLEASQFRQKFFLLYKGVAAYHQRIRREWRSGTRVSHSLDGRRRVWSKRTKPTLNELLNHPIQGTNATIIKRAIALLDSTLLSKVPKIKLILVVHDEIVLEVPQELADKAARCLSDCAVKAAKPILTPIPVEVEVKILNSWGI